MTAAFVEHHPRSSDPETDTTHHTVVVDGTDHGSYKTQAAAKDWACRQRYEVHVARERHLQNRDTPAHWRKDPC